MKDLYTIIYYSDLYDDWEVHSRVYEKADAGPDLARLLTLNASPMLVESYKAEVLINVLNATPDEIKEVRRVWCQQCHTTGQQHKMDCSNKKEFG